MSADPYDLYLARFQEKIGDVAVGGFGKHGTQLIKKLDAAEFAALWKDFVELRTNYDKMMEMGLTVDNIIIKLLRERASTLIVDFEM